MFYKRITVLILNWNGKELLETFLPSVVNNSPQMLSEVIVADNGSTDDSLELLRTQFPTVGLITFEKNLGFAEGYNQAMRKITTPFAVLLNNDVEVTPGWLKPPLDILESNPDVACVQPKIRSYSKRRAFEYAGAAGGFMDRFGYPFCRGRIFDTLELDYGQYDRNIDLLWGSGACLFVRTAAYKKEGGLDESFFAHQEEIDFCWRLRCRGHRIVYTNASYVYHKGGGTLNVSNPHKTYLNFRNNLLMIYKNMPARQLGFVLFMRYLLDRIAAVQFFIKGNRDDARAILKAHREFRRIKANYRKARFANLRQTKLASIPEIMNKSLLWAYYVQRRTTFGTLGFINEILPKE
ncbi:MAG: glycosyltransferase family 2 protein [Tannerellaceae bacterium]|jgi:GT2 family glycosyltransferase|nr:glycosyltransferase family 2 protein [Tannerellaceae bacterium]